MTPFDVTMHDNDTTATAQSFVAKRCPLCNLLIDKWAVPMDNVRIKQRKLDLSCTLDGFMIASTRFVNMYSQQSLTGLRFSSLPNDPGFHVINFGKVVHFDWKRALTRFESKCSICGQYESVVVPSPVAVDFDEIPREGFVRTDLEFGSDDEKSPLMLCGDQAGEFLAKHKVRGMVLRRL